MQMRLAAGSESGTECRIPKSGDIYERKVLAQAAPQRLGSLDQTRFFAHHVCALLSLRRSKMSTSEQVLFSIMKYLKNVLFLASVSLFAAASSAEPAPPIPRFSTGYMDEAVAPADDFYHYADGTWLKKNPVPPDKSRWASFSELQERNWHLIHDI